MGIPKYLLTVAVAEGREVVVPMTTPASIVAVGPPPGYAAAAAMARVSRRSIAYKDAAARSLAIVDDRLTPSQGTIHYAVIKGPN